LFQFQWTWMHAFSVSSVALSPPPKTHHLTRHFGWNSTVEISEWNWCGQNHVVALRIFRNIQTVVVTSYNDLTLSGLCRNVRVISLSCLWLIWNATVWEVIRNNQIVFMLVVKQLRVLRIGVQCGIRISLSVGDQVTGYYWFTVSHSLSCHLLKNKKLIYRQQIMRQLSTQSNNSMQLSDQNDL